MKFTLQFSLRAQAELQALKEAKALHKRYKAALKTLGLMQLNLRHPSLHTHKFHNFDVRYKEEVFESYAENHTPGAYRVFWRYGPTQGTITILAITPHP